MKHFYFVNIYILCVCLFFNCSSTVIELTNDTLLTHFKEYDYGFVFFYSNDSPFCHSILPVLNATSYEIKQLNLTNSSISIAQINIDKYPSILKQHNIQHIPSIIWFNNKLQLLIEYLGETEMSSYFISYIKRNINFTEHNGLKRISSYNELSNEIFSKNKTKPTNDFDKPNSILLICNNNSSNVQFQMLINSAFNIGINNILYTNHTNDIETICKGDKEIEMYMFKINNIGILQYEYINITQSDFTYELNNKDMIHIEPYDKLTVHLLEKIMLMYSKENINLFTKENEDLISQGINTLTIVHNFTLNSTSYNNLISNLLPITYLYRKDFLFMLGTPRTKFSQLFIDSFNIKNTSFPSICLTHSNTTSISKYKTIIPSTNVNEIISSITSFIHQLQQGQLHPYITSQDGVVGNETDENGIMYLNGYTYENIFNNNKDVLIMYCSFKIDICNEYMPRFKKLANRLQHNVNLTIAYIDPYENEIYNVYYNYLPGIVLFKASDYKQTDIGEEYEGKLISKSIIEFIKKHALYEINVKDNAEEMSTVKEEMEKELKRMELDKPGTMRKVYQMILDPQQAKLYMNHNKSIEYYEEEYISYQLLMNVKERNYKSNEYYINNNNDNSTTTDL